MEIEVEPLVVQFRLPKFVIYQTICDLLERDSRTSEAVVGFWWMQSELELDATIDDERAQWELGEWLSEP